MKPFVAFAFFAGAIAKLAVATPAFAGYAEAAAYSESNNGVSMVVIKDGAVVFEDYKFAIDKFISWPVYSGTKGVTAAVAALAVKKGLIGDIDDLAATYLPEWASDPVKSTVTISDLLNLSSGIDTPPIGEGASLSYAAAVALPFTNGPDQIFEWGPASYQVFGEIIRRQLAAQGYSYRDGMEFFYNEVMRPIGAIAPIQRWEKSPDGFTVMSTGSLMTADAWARIGLLILNDGVHNGGALLDAATIAKFRNASTPNPGFGAGWGLAVELPPGTLAAGGIFDQTEIWLPDPNDVIPDDLLMAAGVGRQRLYIVPSLGLVVVRQAGRAFFGFELFDDQEFWRLLLN